MKIFSANALNIIPRHRWAFGEFGGSDVFDTGRKGAISGTLTNASLQSGGPKELPYVNFDGTFPSQIQFSGSAGSPELEFLANESGVFAFWFKNDTPVGSTSHGIITKGFHDATVNAPSYLIRIDNNGSGDDKIIVDFDGSSLNFVIVGTVDVSDGDWHRVVVVRDVEAGEHRLYIDGVLDGTDSSTFFDVGQAAGDDMYFGRHFDRAFEFDMADVIIQKGTIWTLDEIQRDFLGFGTSQIFQPSQRKLFLWNRLDNNNSVAKNEIGPDMTLIGSPTFEPGKFGNGTRKDGLGDGANQSRITTGTVSREDFTIEFWWTRKTIAAFGNILSGYEAPGNNNYFVFSFRNGSSGLYTLETGIRVNGPTFYQVRHDFGGSSAFASAFPLDTPQHLAITKRNSNGEIKFYLNKVELSTSVVGGAASVSEDNEGAWPFPISTNGFDNNFSATEGIVDNIKWYNYIKTDFSDFNIEGPGKLLHERINREVVTLNKSKFLRLWNKLGNAAEISDSEVGYDLSVPGSPTFVQGKFNSGSEGAISCLKASSHSDCPKVPIGALFVDDFTIEFWYKRTEGLTPASDNYLLSHPSAGPSNPRMILNLHTTNDPNRINFTLINASGDVRTVGVIKTQAEMETIFSLNDWHHLAFTKRNSDGEMKIYIDNVEQTLDHTAGNASFVTGIFGFLADVHTIGNIDSVAGVGAAGYIDNFKVFNYAKEDFSDSMVESPVDLQDLII